MITIYGCVRQGTQVACDADFNNQNQNNTMVTNGWWGDMYVVDSNGDRHNRASAYFVNGAGEPRDRIDIPYGQAARYILMFNDVPSNVSTVSVHSAYGQIDIENIRIDGSNNAAPAAAASGASGSDQPAQAQGSSPTGQASQDIKNTGKQAATDAQQKAVGKGQDTLNNWLNKVPH
jgi:hypothetical protein